MSRRALALVCCLAFVLAACGGGKKEAATTTTSSTAAPTTTTAAAGGFPAGAAPLTALPANPALLNRPALAVKIDNAPKARPQAGLLQADIVIEEKVEDGVTRFFTIYQSQDADPVGPVRSARTTDIALASSLNRPLFAYSGTNATFQRAISSAPLVDVGHNAAAGDYRRDGKRPAPYNLFITTPGLYRKAPAGAGPPPPQLQYRPAGQPLAGGAPAAGVHVEFRGKNITTIADWRWDAGSASWLRAQDGSNHVDSRGGQVSAKNVIVQFVEYIDTGERDQSNTVVPEGKVVGSGEAWIFTDGKVVKGRWARPAPENVTAYTDASGAPVLLTPGQTWVELPPPGAATSN
jgi:hypothetical protein